MQDFLIQCKNTGYMGIAGPAIVEAQLGEKISLEELSGMAGACGQILDRPI